ncbi:MAG TPA: hypothetical protein VGQ65_24900 [Thermoanaerobaculia bacterium]|jgi:hypothetical protein|nr:hypothetical protein [Thermoanaerobaculia bacterium]
MTADTPWINVDLFAGDSSTAVGVEARCFATTEREIISEWLAAPITGAPLRDGLRAIMEAASETQRTNWDGNGAAPFKQRALLNAVRLLKRLPVTMPVDDVYVDADGAVLLEWQTSTKRSFTVAVNEHGELHFAGVFGLSRLRGRDIFVGDRVPESIRLGIRRVFDA